jgi:hypothetical protein
MPWTCLGQRNGLASTVGRYVAWQGHPCWLLGGQLGPEDVGGAGLSGCVYVPSAKHPGQGP